jgi:hypothetical protein
MPIRGDRLRWPPRPGKRSRQAALSGTRRSPSTEAQPENPNPPPRQPDECDESADRQSSAPRTIMQQAHDDIQAERRDTDRHNQTAEVLDRNSNRRQKP